MPGIAGEPIKGVVGKPTSVTFLGTCSGGGPIPSRNCSSLAVNIDGVLWLFDCAEGTQMQLQNSKLKMSKITRIFITHVHADHCLGLVPLLSTIMAGMTSTPESQERLKAEGVKKKAKIHIYGPPGLRLLLRQTLTITSCSLADAYAVHELIPEGGRPSASCGAEDLHANEAVGRDMWADAEGCWEDVLREEQGAKGKGKEEWRVDVGPIDHRVQSLGYVLSEPLIYDRLDPRPLIPLLESNRSALALLKPPISNPRTLLSHISTTHLPYTLPSGDILQPPSVSSFHPRKLVVLGDCSGTSSSRFIDLAKEPSLLVHECTNAWIPDGVEKGAKGRQVRTEELDAGLVGEAMKKGWTPCACPKVEGGDEHACAFGEEEGREAREEEQREGIRRKAVGRGHSTADMAGAFAKRVGAKRLALNHFSCMFPSPKYPTDGPFPSLLSLPPSHSSPSLHPSELHKRLIMSSIESQATTSWSASPSCRAVAARDLMTYEVPTHEVGDGERGEMERAGREARGVGEAWVEGGAERVGELFGVHVGEFGGKGKGKEKGQEKSNGKGKGKAKAPTSVVPPKTSHPITSQVKAEEVKAEEWEEDDVDDLLDGAAEEPLEERMSALSINKRKGGRRGQGARRRAKTAKPSAASGAGAPSASPSTVNGSTISQLEEYPATSTAASLVTAEGDIVGLTYEVLNEQGITESVKDDGAGAVAVFVGTTRDSFEGKEVTRLTYEAYSALCIKTFASIALAARDLPTQSSVTHRLPSESPIKVLTRVAIHHRLGEVPVGQASIVIAVSSPHRREAFHACEWILEEVKKKGQVWKKEWYATEGGEGEEGAKWKENFPAAGGTGGGKVTVV